MQVVRKEFKPFRKKSEYDLELRNLSILRVINHPNIIKLLGSYTYRDNHNFIFPLARGGTLADFLNQSRPDVFKPDEKIMIALSGLCSALSTVHDLFSDDHTLLAIGCHHDLKPGNILIDGDAFLLADFGLSRFKESTEDSKTSYKSVGGYYVAPECEDVNEVESLVGKRIIGRKSDIWSLGCIMTEVLIFMKRGVEGVKMFESSRSYRVEKSLFRRFHRGPNQSEPAVEAQLKELSEKANTRSESMLIKLIKQILQLDPEIRPKAKEVEAKMRFIAIDSISHQIQDLYTRAWQKGSSTQVFLEQVRFSSWMQFCEILYTSKDSYSSGGWRVRSQSEYQSTLDCLSEIRDTLEAITPEFEKPGRLVYRPLKQLNDVLLDSLPDQLQDCARDRLEFEILGAEADNLIEEVSHNFHGLERKRIGMLATIKKMSLLVAERSHTRRDDLFITPRRLKGKKQCGDHYLSRLNCGNGEREVQILYESKKYGEHQLDEEIRVELHRRLEAIAELLQKVEAEDLNEFRVLQCSGYFHDVAELSCGLVYRFPDESGSEDLDVVTLHMVLTERRTPPLLGNRFQLARNLAASVLEFHKVAWLQKAISSFNIVFFYPNALSWRKGIEKPYFLGFVNSRPNQPTAFTEYMDNSSQREYQHPEYLRSEGKIRYRPEFDYYSLGMVLLEIGTWKPLTKLVQVSGSPENTLIKLREIHVASLGQSMGVIYRDVVEACLSGDFGGSETENEESNKCNNIHLSFARAVVEQLAKCIV